MKFSKQKMIDRLTKEGNADKINDYIISIMDNLDGQTAEASCWRRTVNCENVYWVVGKNGSGEYVNGYDCI